MIVFVLCDIFMLKNPVNTAFLSILPSVRYFTCDKSLASSILVQNLGFGIYTIRRLQTLKCSKQNYFAFAKVY